MAKKKKSNHKKSKFQKIKLDKINEEIMPRVSTIQNKMKMLKERFNLTNDFFDFKEITMEEILNPDKN